MSSRLLGWDSGTRRTWDVDWEQGEVVDSDYWKTENATIGTGRFRLNYVMVVAVMGKAKRLGRFWTEN